MKHDHLPLEVKILQQLVNLARFYVHVNRKLFMLENSDHLVYKALANLERKQLFYEAAGHVKRIS